METQMLCSMCGGRFPRSDLAAFDKDLVCATCKPSYVQKVREGVATLGLNLASNGSRFAAKIVDGLILWVVNIGYMFALGYGIEVSMGQEEPENPILYLALSMFGYVLNFAYVAGFTWKKGATPGKMALKICVVRADGNPLTLGRACGRAASEWLSSAILGIGYLLAFFDKEKRTLHDRICDTRVIRKS